MTTVKIKNNEWYTMQDIVNGKFFAWANNTFWSVRNIVTSDRKNKNILKAVVSGSGTGTKYKFKGENIIKFIKAVEDGKIQL